jgi:MerR family transcriptional regulator, thiopeptide resistance regulator
VETSQRLFRFVGASFSHVAACRRIELKRFLLNLTLRQVLYFVVNCKKGLMGARTTTWRIGELAEQAGITVRTLHHYDRLGLLSPSSRTSGGHRCYSSEDVVRLQRIIALRSCGLSLEEIGAVLSAGADGGLADLLRRQLEVVNERIRQAVALRIRLLGILGALDQTVEPSITEILRLIEDTTIVNHPFTAEQFAQQRERRARQVREMSAEAFAALKEKLQQTWAALGRDEQALLVRQRRVMPSTSDGAKS